MKMKTVIILGATALSPVMANAAAIVPPEATYDSWTGTYPAFTSTHETGIGSHSDGSSSVVLSAAPSPSILVDAVKGVSNLPTAAGRISYYVGVSGAGGASSVPLIAQYSMWGVWQPTGGAYNYGPLSSASVGISAYQAPGDGGCNCTVGVGASHNDGNFSESGTLRISVIPGLYATVSLEAYAGIDAHNDEAGGVARAYVDPVFSIDPDFLAANPGYSLVFSEGVGNAPQAGAVPEPATWAMMLGGFGIVGVGLRRRTVSVPAVTA